MRIDIMQLEFIEKVLRTIVTETEKDFGVEFTVTSLFRIGDDGVHGQLKLRGIDFKCRLMAFGQMVAEHVNKRWQYDPHRPEMVCCKCHDVGGGLHLHFQSHPNTVWRL